MEPPVMKDITWSEEVGALADIVRRDHGGLMDIAFYSKVGREIKVAVDAIALDACGIVVWLDEA
jgi:hypothetical protein